MNKLVITCQNSPKFGLTFVPLYVAKISIVLFIDVGFATNKDMTSQLGYVMVLMDDKNNANNVHYGSTKSKRITRSVLAAELFAMVQGFDVCSTIRIAINEMFDRSVPLNIYTDSRSLFDCQTNINRTTEKRLLIDLCMLRESYERREISEVFWIPTHQNPADAFTKTSP